MIDGLAQEIRRVDGSHNLGAGALAEALRPFIDGLLAKAVAAAYEDAARRAMATLDEARQSLWKKRRHLAARDIALISDAYDLLAATESAPMPDLPDDLLSHKSAWRNALTLARDSAPPSREDFDDRGYWQHEIDVFDRVHADLETLRARAPHREASVPDEETTRTVAAQRCLRTAVAGKPREEIIPVYVATILDALATNEAAPVAREDGVRSGWIVSNANGDKFRCWIDGWSNWTDDRDAATRYARRQDAEAVHAEDDDAWRVVPFDLAALETPPRAAVAQGEAVGYAGTMPGTIGFTMAAFRAEDVPVGTPLYALAHAETQDDGPGA